MDRRYELLSVILDAAASIDTHEDQLRRATPELQSLFRLTVGFVENLMRPVTFNFFLYFLSPSSFIPPQNVVYFLMLHFLVHKIFTFYINGVLNCKYPAPGPAV